MLKFNSLPPEKGKVQFSTGFQTVFMAWEIYRGDEDYERGFLERMHSFGEATGRILVANAREPDKTAALDILADLTTNWKQDELFEAFQEGAKFGIDNEVDDMAEYGIET